MFFRLHRVLRFWVFLLSAVGIPGVGMAAYNVRVLSGNVSTRVVNVGDTFPVEVVLESSAGSQIDLAQFRLLFSVPGLRYESYAWSAPFLNGTIEDDSKPLRNALPVIVAASTYSGRGNAEGAVDVGFSNVTDLTLTEGVFFQSGVLLTATFSAPPELVAGSVRVSAAVEAFLQGFDAEQIGVVSDLVLTVNHPPSFASSGVISAFEHVELRSQLTAVDPDLPAQTLRFSKVSGPVDLVVSESGLLQWTPGEADGGQKQEVVVAISDGLLSTQTRLEVSVAEVNSEPVLSVPSIPRVEEASPLVMQLSGSDSDLPVQSLTFEKLSGPSELSVSRAGLLQWVPGEADGGTLVEVRVAVSDGLSRVERSIVLNVEESNQAPRFESSALLSTIEGSPLTFQLHARDDDSPSQPLSYGLVLGPSGLTISASGLLRWVPGESDGGARFTAIASVTDGVVTAQQRLEIIVNEENRAPQFVTPQLERATERVPYRYRLSATDPDSPEQGLVFSKTSGPEGLSIGFDGTMTWTPGELHGGGTFLVTARVADGVDATEITFEVAVDETNEPPVVELTARQTVFVGEMMSVRVNATDPDIPAQPLRFSKTSGPAGLLIDEAGVVNWKPTDADLGSIVASIAVTDGVIVKNVSLFVAVEPRPNTAPTLLGLLPRYSSLEDAPLTFEFQVQDVESSPSDLQVTARSGDERILAQTTLDAALPAFGTSGRRVVLTPSVNQFGEVPITLTIRDRRGGDGARVVSQTVVWSVESVNDLPTIVAPKDIIAEVGTELPEVVLEVGDIETRVPDLKVSIDSSSNVALVPVSEVRVTGNVLRIEPIAGRTGTSVLEVQVTDADGGFARVAFGVNILPKPNTPPSLGSIADVTGAANTPIEVPISTSDRETPLADLGFEVVSDNTNLFPANSITVSPDRTRVLLHPSHDAFGTAHVSVRVIDEGGLEAIARFQVRVAAPPVAPVLRLDDPRQTQIVMDEDSIVRVGFGISDSDSPHDALKISVSTTNPELLSSLLLSEPVTGEAGRVLTLSPASDRSGSGLVTMVVSDGVLQTRVELKVTVRPVNDLPILSGLRDLEFVAGQTSVPIEIQAVDTETLASGLRFEVSPEALGVIDPGDVRFFFVAGRWTMTVRAAAGRVGTSRVAVTVVDGDGGRAVGDFVVKVTTPNLGPSIQAPAEWTLREDEPTVMATTDRPGTAPILIFGDDTTPVGLLQMGVVATDLGLFPEGRVSLEPLLGRANARQLRMVPAPNRFGEATIRVTARDSQGLETTALIRVVVKPVNDLPTLAVIDAQVGDENGQIGPVKLSIGDLETPLNQLRVSLSSDNEVLFPSGSLVWDSGLGAIRLKPAAGRNGAATVNVVVEDLDGGKVGRTIPVLVRPVNQPPVVSSLDARVMDVNGVLRLPVVIRDVDSDSEQFRVDAAVRPGDGDPSGLFLSPGIIRLSREGTGWWLELEPRKEIQGHAVIRVVARDAEGAESLPSEFELTVRARPVGPLLTFPDGLTMTVVEGGVSAPMRVVLGDGTAVGSAGLSLTARSLASTLFPDSAISLRPSEGAVRNLEVTALKGSAGFGEVELTLANGAGESASYRVGVVVSRRPTIALISGLASGRLEIFENTQSDLVRFRLEDAETPRALLRRELIFPGPAPASPVVVGPGDVEMVSDAEGIGLRVIPKLNSTGEAEVLLRVTDGDGGTAEFPVVVSVKARPPVVELVAEPGEVVVAGQPLALRSRWVGGSKPVAYQWSRDGAELKGETGSELIVPVASVGSAGRYRLEARNAGGVGGAGLTVTVLAPPRILAHPQSQTLSAGERLRLGVRVEEGPGVLSYQWRKGGRPIEGETSPVLTREIVESEDAGVYDVLIAREDTGLPIRSESANVEVRAETLLTSDAFAAAPLLPSGVTVVSGLREQRGSGQTHNRGATREELEPLHAGKVGGHSVWVRWTAPADGTMRLSTRGSSFDTLLAVYRPSTNPGILGRVETIDSDDDGGDAFTSVLQFNARLGQVYYVAIDGRAGAVGSIHFSWVFQEGRGQAIEIIAQLADVVTREGERVILNVVALNVSTYRWYFNGSLLPAETSSELLVDPVGVSNVGRYEVVVANEKGEKSSHAQLVLSTEPRSTVTDKSFDAALIANGPSAQGLMGGGGGFGRTAAAAASGFRGTQVFSTFGASVEVGEPEMCGLLGGASQWQTYVAPSDGVLLVSTEGSNFDTLVGVYTGPPDQGFEGLTLLACDNDSGPDGRTSRLRVPVKAGQTYYVAVDGVGGRTGVVRLTYQLSLPVIAIALPPPRMEAGIAAFTIPAVLGARYVIQTSPNLVAWRTVLSTNAVSASLEFKDVESGVTAVRFYRVLRESPGL